MKRRKNVFQCIHFPSSFAFLRCTQNKKRRRRKNSYDFFFITQKWIKIYVCLSGSKTIKIPPIKSNGFTFFFHLFILYEDLLSEISFDAVWMFYIVDEFYKIAMSISGGTSHFVIKLNNIPLYFDEALIRIIGKLIKQCTSNKQ